MNVNKSLYRGLNISKGGYGLYFAAETRIKDRIDDFTLSELVKLTKYFYVPNIGSNEF